MAVRLAQYDSDVTHKPGYYDEVDFLSRKKLQNNEQFDDSDDDGEEGLVLSIVNGTCYFRSHSTVHFPVKGTCSIQLKT